MSSVVKNKGVIKAGPAVASFPDLLVARPDPNQNLKYSVTLIFKGPEKETLLKPLRDAVKVLLKEKFPDGKVPKNLKLPFRKGEEYSDKTGYDEDDVFVQFSRKESFGEVPVVGPRREKLTARDIYPGMIGIVATRPYFWHHKETNKKGVSFGLEGFQKVKDAERLGGFDPLDVDEAFDVIEVNGGEVPFETEE